MNKPLLVYLLLSVPAAYSAEASVKKPASKAIKISNISNMEEVRAYTDNVVITPNTPPGAVKGMLLPGLSQREQRMTSKMHERRAQIDPIVSSGSIPLDKARYLATIPWGEEDSDEQLPGIVKSLYKYTKTATPVLVKPYQDFTLLAIATLDHSGKCGCDTDVVEGVVKESIIHGNGGYDEIMSGKRKDDGSIASPGIQQDLSSIINKTSQSLDAIMQTICYLKIAHRQRQAHITSADAAQKAKLIKQNELLAQKIELLQEDICKRILVRKDALHRIAAFAAEEIDIVKILDAESMDDFAARLKATHKPEVDEEVVIEEDGIDA